MDNAPTIQYTCLSGPLIVLMIIPSVHYGDWLRLRSDVLTTGFKLEVFELLSKLPYTITANEDRDRKSTISYIKQSQEDFCLEASWLVISLVQMDSFKPVGQRCCDKSDTVLCLPQLDHFRAVVSPSSKKSPMAKRLYLTHLSGSEEYNVVN